MAVTTLTILEKDVIGPEGSVAWIKVEEGIECVEVPTSRYIDASDT